MIKNSVITFAVVVCLAFAPAVPAQDNATTQGTPTKSAAAASSTEEQNLKEYITLLREDVRSQKFAVINAVMQLNPDQATKFWPIYRDYDDELKKVNDLRVANIEEYSRSYSQLTDAKADKLIQNEMSYQKQSIDLLARYYDRMRGSIDAITAARFVHAESQLLLIIDLQIDSSLPLAGY